MLKRFAFLTCLSAGLCLDAVLAAENEAAPEVVPTAYFAAPGGLEVTLWAQSPLLRNPTNMDVDKDGRIWIAEGVNYRRHMGRRKEGDRIVVLEDSNRDGLADKSWTFVQEEFLVAPLGVAVFDNQVVVSQTPDLIVYTDVNRNLVFDPGTDRREVLLTGFNGRNHDHSLHSVYAGPGGQWHFSAGNCGALFTDRSGKTFRIGGPYGFGSMVPGQEKLFDNTAIAGKPSDDGHVWIGGFCARMDPDGRNVEIIGNNFRNSYEQAVTSFGDVFQNDNDDPPACRVAYVLEYGNAGFASADGRRTWRVDKRPGQDIPTAEWRQEDPGTMPAGDVYGGGSPTGVAFYENGALGKKWQGLLLSCEAGRNVVFGYLPEPEGAGFKLERFDFLTSNPDKQFAGSDFLGGNDSVTSEIKTLFRPSDVCVGPDGAVYVADWFDPRVGGHADLDEGTHGAIYRIAPKGFRPKVPKIDFSKTKGQIAALKSPANNVRHTGYVKLRAQGQKAVPAVAKLLDDRNPWIRARAVWLLADLGHKGVAKVEELLKHEDAQFRVVAFRALRHKTGNVLSRAKALAGDKSPAVRREVALALRDVPFEQAKDILLTLARGYDGQDRTYLEALGTGCHGKEAQMYDLISETLGASNPLKWSKAFAGIAWRLHPAKSIDAFKQRALSEELSAGNRKAAMVAIAFNESRPASSAMIDVASKTTDAVRADAIWWLLNRKNNHWRDYGIMPVLKKQGVYDPDAIELTEVIIPEPSRQGYLPPNSEILKLKGNPALGKQIATACLACHKIGDQGAEYGPTLTGWARNQTSDVVLRSIIDPSADIAHGFTGYEIQTKDGLTIHGLVLSDSDPVIVQSTGGITQTVPKKRIKSKKPLGRSLMISAEQMGLQPQNLADLVAYLKSI